MVDKTAIKNCIHAGLHQRLLKCPFSDLFCLQGRQWLQTLLLDEEGGATIDSDLRLLRLVETELARQDQVLATRACDEPHLKLLMTLPGVSLVVDQTLWAVLGEVERFRDADHAES